MFVVSVTGAVKSPIEGKRDYPTFTAIFNASATLGDVMAWRNSLGLIDQDNDFTVNAATTISTGQPDVEKDGPANKYR